MGEGFRYKVQNFFHKIISPFMIFKESIQKITEWIPVIWYDRDWDQSYIYKLLEHKFDAMSKYQHRCGYSINHDKYSNELAKARDLCHKLLHYDYGEEATKPFYKKYPNFEVKYWSQPCGPDLYEYKDNLSEEQSKFLAECAKHEQELYDADKNKLFKYISDHIETWWD